MSDNAGLGIRRFWRMILLLVGVIVLLVGIELQGKLLGLPMVLPPRMFRFAILSDFICICFFFWQIRRVKKRAIEPSPASPPSRFMNELLKALGYYAAIEAGVCGIVLLVADVPLRVIFRGFLLFLVPGLVGLPLIFYARQSFDRPKAGAVRFALALSLLFLSVVLSFTYSGLVKWMGVPSSAGGDITVALLGTAFVATYTYHSTHKRLGLKKTTNHITKPTEQPPAHNA